MKRENGVFYSPGTDYIFNVFGMDYHVDSNDEICVGFWLEQEFRVACEVHMKESKFNEALVYLGDL